MMSEYRNIMESLVEEEFERENEGFGVDLPLAGGDVLGGQLVQGVGDDIVSAGLAGAALIPSYFGMEYAAAAEEVYRVYKQTRIREDDSESEA